MITKELKISKLLNDHPESLEVLIRLNPHFEKLRNNILRKALAGRVTIEQAAGVAGIGLKELLFELNTALGFNTIDQMKDGRADLEPERIEQKPVYLQSVRDDKLRLLDVRPIIDSGADPFKDIMSAVKKLQNDEVLVIKNSFEPVPLYTVLGKKGFTHWTENGDGCFTVYFYKDNIESRVETLSFDSSGRFDENDFEKILDVDVHDLQPPEPMLKILENLIHIDEQSLMRVHHHREPVLLYPKLEERGYRAYCEKLGENNYKILIGKKA